MSEQTTDGSEQKWSCDHCDFVGPGSEWPDHVWYEHNIYPTPLGGVEEGEFLADTGDQDDRYKIDE